MDLLEDPFDKTIRYDENSKDEYWDQSEKTVKKNREYRNHRNQFQKTQKKPNSMGIINPEKGMNIKFTFDEIENMDRKDIDWTNIKMLKNEEKRYKDTKPTEHEEEYEKEMKNPRKHDFLESKERYSNSNFSDKYTNFGFDAPAKSKTEREFNRL